MQTSLPQTALPGRSRSAQDQLAKKLGYFSIALGLAEIVFPRAASRAAGVPGRKALMRAYGGREIATGVAILTSHDPTPWIWGRVLGDALDIATVATGLRDVRRNGGSAGATLAMLAAVTAVDVWCAVGLSSEKGDQKSARADYSDRSGFPQGLQSARGTARDVTS